MSQATNNARPISDADAMTAPFWEATKDERFLIQKCSACGEHQHYPRSVCTHCGVAGKLEFVEAGGRGHIYSFTEIHRAPHPAFEAPYVVALVRLQEGPVVMSNILADAAALSCEQPVKLAWRKLEDDRRLAMFVPEEA